MARIRIALKQGARIPARSTDGAAGYDVCALLPIDTEIIIAPGERMLVPTGIFLDIPEGYFVTLRPRSGLALKNGITLLNSPATIDWDYRGELQVILANLGQESFTIRSGDRIAQFLVEKWERADFEEISVESLTGTSRGAGGFGSTGLA